MEDKQFEQFLLDNYQALLDWAKLASIQECPWCKLEFDEPLYLKARKGKWNPEMLIHFQTTHGYSPDIFLTFLREVYEKKYPKARAFFDYWEPTFENMSL